MNNSPRRRVSSRCSPPVIGCTRCRRRSSQSQSDLELETGRAPDRGGGEGPARRAVRGALGVIGDCGPAGSMLPRRRHRGGDRRDRAPARRARDSRPADQGTVLDAAGAPVEAPGLLGLSARPPADGGASWECRYACADEVFGNLYPKKRSEGASSTRTTRASSPRSPRPPAWRSRMPASTRRPASGSGGGTPPRSRPCRCCRGHRPGGIRARAGAAGAGDLPTPRSPSAALAEGEEMSIRDRRRRVRRRLDRKGAPPSTTSSPVRYRAAAVR